MKSAEITRDFSFFLSKKLYCLVQAKPRVLMKIRAHDFAVMKLSVGSSATQHYGLERRVKSIYYSQAKSVAQTACPN
jgi:hypothetical protein